MAYQKKTAATNKEKDEIKVTETVTENKTVKTVEEPKRPKKYEPDDLIPCRSMYAGTLLFTGEKTKITYEFIYRGKGKPPWEIVNAHKMPVEIKIEGNIAKVKWVKTFSGQFVLKCGGEEKTVVVESLF